MNPALAKAGVRRLRCGNPRWLWGALATPMLLAVLAAAWPALAQDPPTAEFQHLPERPSVDDEIVLSAVVGFPVSLDFSEGPVVFDFEDGMQGWVLEGTAERVASEELGGDWAIFGDGMNGSDLPPEHSHGGEASMKLRLEPAVVGALEIDTLFVGQRDPLDLDPHDFISVATTYSNGDGAGLQKAFFPPRPVDGQEGSDEGPVRRRLDVYEGPGWRLETVVISWSQSPCTIDPDTGACRGLDHPDRLLALVDNVTFVPEPGPVFQGLAATLALSQVRRRRLERRRSARAA